MIHGSTTAAGMRNFSRQLAAALQAMIVPSRLSAAEIGQSDSFELAAAQHESETTAAKTRTSTSTARRDFAKDGSKELKDSPTVGKH